MMQELATAIESLEYQRDVKLVTLFGAGKYFSAGFELGDHLGDRGYMMLESFRRIFEALAKVDKPTLAVVAGPALGAGCILAAACDMVLAAQSAKLGHPEIRGGVFNTVAAALLPRLVGRKRAFEILHDGREPHRGRRGAAGARHAGGARTSGSTPRWRPSSSASRSRARRSCS